MWNRSVSGRSIKSFGCTKMLERKAIDRVKANLWKILPTEGSHYLKSFRPIASFMANFRDRINCSAILPPCRSGTSFESPPDSRNFANRLFHDCLGPRSPLIGLGRGQTRCLTTRTIRGGFRERRKNTFSNRLFHG